MQPNEKLTYFRKKYAREREKVQRIMLCIDKVFGEGAREKIFDEYQKQFKKEKS